MRKFLRRLFRRPAIMLVTLWARRSYNQGVKAAEARRETLIARNSGGNCVIYLACDSFHPDRLVTYDKRQFKTEKKVYGVHARLLTMNTLRRGCYYHTADRWGREGMSARDAEVRRRAFIKERLHLAGLI